MRGKGKVARRADELREGMAMKENVWLGNGKAGNGLRGHCDVMIGVATESRCEDTHGDGKAGLRFGMRRKGRARSRNPTNGNATERH